MSIRNAYLAENEPIGSHLLFRSRKHKVKTLKVNKLALSREDNNRITIHGVVSYARGNYRVSGCE